MSEPTVAVLWHVTMSLDGFIAAPGDRMDWIFRYKGPNPLVGEVIQSIGAILAGRRTFNVGDQPDVPPEASKAYGGAWTGPIFVLTHHPPSSPDPAITFLSGDIRAAVARASAAAKGKSVVLFGADIARQCFEAGLVDEIWIHVAPILLGDGVRLFGHEGTASVQLETRDVSQAGQITNLRFRVVKD